VPPLTALGWRQGGWRQDDALPTVGEFPKFPAHTGLAEQHPDERRYRGTDGLYYFVARWYDQYLNRWIQPDSIIPEALQGVQAWDRYVYANNNPIRYNDPSGHCIDPDSCPPDININIDSQEIANNILGLVNSASQSSINVEDLRNFATNADEVALGIDLTAEAVVGGFIAVGVAGGLTFEGNPVTGGAGAAAGWILGETNPVVQGLMFTGNVIATASSAASIFADSLTGATSFQFQFSMSQGQVSMAANMTASSNTMISAFTTAVGWATKIVEVSLLLQSMAVANDHGIP
jgi:RHS repeat-associated protein